MLREISAVRDELCRLQEQVRLFDLGVGGGGGEEGSWGWEGNSKMARS